MLPRPAGAQAELLTCSGAGVNVKQMPSPDGGAMVPLRESFAFDAHYAQCIIEDNPTAFAMDTFSMGRVVIERPPILHGDVLQRDGPGQHQARRRGQRVAKLAGQLGCATYAGPGA